MKRLNVMSERTKCVKRKMVTHAKKNFERTSCVMRSVSARENWELQ